MGIKERLLAFVKSLGISRSEFERKSCLSNGYINNIREGMGADKVESVLRAYPQLNRSWLLTGEGEMLQSKPQQVVDITSGTAIGNNVNGNGNSISHNDMSKMIELQQEYISMLKKKDEQIDKLLEIIAKR